MVTVKLFGTLRLDSGIRELTLEAGRVSDIYPQILSELHRINPDSLITLKDLKSCYVSVNGRQLKARSQLNGDETILLVPPSAGG